MIARDEAGFLSALAALHPAVEHRITAVILLKNLAQKIVTGEGNMDFNQVRFYRFCAHLRSSLFVLHCCSLTSLSAHF